MGREAILYLLEQGVRVLGTDAWSWDASFSFTRQRFADSGDARIIWEGHKAGRDIGYGQMEKLANLDQLPADGFWISCFPYKIEKGSAGFICAVAFLDARRTGFRTSTACRSDCGAPSIAKRATRVRAVVHLASVGQADIVLGERCLRCC
jgi:hypothetical protein